jgi:tRNA-dihydrouridine synthase B
MFKIGNIQLDRVLALAPMEDVTDIPFRLICKQMGADLVYTEFTNCEALVRDVKKSLDKIRVVEEERPVAVQIYGSLDQSMEGAAAVAEAADPDFIDINCGCWVKKVALREAGAGLLRNLPKFEAIVKAVVRGTSLPVTVKTRLGWDPDSIVILDVARMLEDLGVQCLSVHCRTRKQGHAGDANWSWLEKLKNTVSMPIIGNGDVTTPEDVARMFETGCDGVMIGRGAIGRPWLFRDARYLLEHGELPPPITVQERIDICIEHLRLTHAFKPGRRALFAFRKHYAGYLRGIPHGAELRSELMQLEDVDSIKACLRRFADSHAVESVA